MRVHTYIYIYIYIYVCVCVCVCYMCIPDARSRLLQSFKAKKLCPKALKIHVLN